MKMDRQANTTRRDLEWMLFDESAKPRALPLSLLKDVTNDFSHNQQIGSGGFAMVYKGMLENGDVAVKKLTHMIIDETKFSQEICCLMKAKHKNIVRFLGYCSDTQGEMVNYNGEYVMADVQQRLLCFEYVSNGSLDEYIKDAPCRLGWRKCYQVIKGICEGLHYLHKKQHIVHLDLKPANILLDDNMIPKIADFGLSRCFNEKQSRFITRNIAGTLGYLAPEYLGGHITYNITYSSDIYSLGVIILEMLTGQKDDIDVEDILESWTNRLEISQRATSLEQIRVCAVLGKECTASAPMRRPDTQHIINRLDEAEGADWSIETDGSSSSVKRLDTTRGKSTMTSLFENPPRVTCNSFHPLHGLKMVIADGKPFQCDGCMEPGEGRRYRCGPCNFNLHTCCALLPATLDHPLFSKGTFTLFHKPPTPVGHRLCELCDGALRGFVYENKRGVYLHPCCAFLPARIVLYGLFFHLQRSWNRCGLCGVNHWRTSWAYRLEYGGEDVNLHLACLKEGGRHTIARGSSMLLAITPITEAMLQNFVGFARRLRRQRGTTHRDDEDIWLFYDTVRDFVGIVVAVISGNPMPVDAAVEVRRGLLPAVRREAGYYYLTIFNSIYRLLKRLIFG